VCQQLHGVPHEVGVPRLEEKLDEGKTLGEEHPNIFRDSDMIQDEKVQAQ